MMKKTNPKFIVVTVISLLFLFVLLGAVYFMTHFVKGNFSESSNQIQDYRQWSLPEKYSRLLVFPETVPSSAENVKYYYQYDSGWGRPMCQIYLSCTLSDEEYGRERERLAGLSYTGSRGTIEIKQDKESFLYPAYVAVEGYDFCYEYALLDDQWNHVVYVYTMNTIEQDIKFSKQELPDYFMEDFDEFSVSGLDRFTMYGGYDEQEK